MEKLIRACAWCGSLVDDARKVIRKLSKQEMKLLEDKIYSTCCKECEKVVGIEIDECRKEIRIC